MIQAPACKRCGHLRYSHRGACMSILPSGWHARGDVASDKMSPAGFALCSCPEYQDPEEPDRLEPPEVDS